MKKIIFGVFISAFLFACNNEKKDDKSATDATATTASADKKAGDELLDMSEGEAVKNALNAFSKGDIVAMTANYADDVRYQWSGGDSLVGKKAVQDYYKGRWNLIDSLNFSDHIVLPVKVNMQQSPAAPTGKWVLHWAFAHVKYKNGKKLDFWVHNVNHYNDAGKIDFVGQYLDRHPIMEATTGLVK
jgi:ketosteroid isomerase-like protein